MDRSKPTTFRKLQVVGPRDAVLPVADAAFLSGMEHPTVGALAQTAAEMTHAVTKSRKRGRNNPTADLAVYDACLQRLRALKTQFDESYDPLVHALTRRMLKVAPPDTVAPTPLAAPAQAAVAGLVAPPAQVALPLAPPPPPAPPAPLKAMGTPTGTSRIPLSSTARQGMSTEKGTTADIPSPTSRTPIDPATLAVQNVLPSNFHKKFLLLTQYMLQHPDKVTISKQGRLVVDGAVVTGANYVDTFRDLYVSRAGADVGAMFPLVKSLYEIGVPVTLMSSALAKQIYTSLQQKEVSTKKVTPEGSSLSPAVASEVPVAESESKLVVKQQEGKGVEDDYHKQQMDIIRASIEKVLKQEKLDRQMGRGVGDVKVWPGRPVKVLRLYQ